MQTTFKIFVSVFVCVVLSFLAGCSNNDSIEITRKTAEQGHIAAQQALERLRQQ